MKRPVKILFYSVGLTVLTSTIVLSCGPFFPWQLLSNRQETFAQMPGIDHFSSVVQSLVSLNATEKRNLLSADSVTNQENSQQNTCLNLNDDYKHGADLFHHQQWEEAYLVFTALSYNSPPAQQVCARYTLGRIERQLGKIDDAIETFNSTAYLVSQGAPDPLHLGISAYGEAAGLILDQLGTRTNKDGTITWRVGEVKPDSAMQLERAVRLYATQAVLGDNGGDVSIIVILQGLTDPHNLNAKILLDQTISSNTIRQPLMAYLLNNFSDRQDIYTPAFSDDVQKNILDALMKAEENHKDLGKDVWKIAAFAYKNKNFKVAKHWAEYDWTQYKKSADAWILAKIALMEGRKEDAQRYYHDAVTFIQDGTIIPSAQQRIRGEQAVLTLSQGGFVQALEQLWPVRDQYFGDIVYLAENVLTTDELIQFTNRRTFPPSKGQMIKMDWMYDYSLSNTPLIFRNMVAHRLVREGRLKEAKAYFVNPTDQQILDKYSKALYDMRHSFWATDRAKAAWNAANIINEYGMELSGTYGYPDQYPGDYPDGIGQFQGPKNNPNNRKWSVPAEQVRTGASWPIPNRRFHYRYVAVQYALNSANLIPKQSQAYAALLCHANGWMQNTAAVASLESNNNHKIYDDISDSKFAFAKSRELYNQYLKNGAVVPFATHFGYNCPQPEFNQVPSVKRKLFWNQIKSGLSKLKHFNS